MKLIYYRFYWVLIVASLCSCSFAPTYHRPAMAIPEDYKEVVHWKKEAAMWQPAKQNMAEIPLGPWWQVFCDPHLNALEEQLSQSNQSLKQALARYLQTRAYLQATRSYLYPKVLGIGNADKQQTSNTTANRNPVRYFSDFLIAAELTYELDVWGRVRNLVKAQTGREQASAADLAGVSLSLHATLASTYFSLRGADAQQRVLDARVKSYEKALYLTRQRFRGGVAPEIDVDQAVTQLENTKTLAADIRLQRAQLEHVIAVLIGEIPSNIKIPPMRTKIKHPRITAELPSTLLERRPDIVAAEERVAAANAEIGVARAAFFPRFNLISIAGKESRNLSRLFSSPSTLWSLGPITALTLVQPVASVVLFDAGHLLSLLRAAKANYFETVALYRQTVLTAFQEVEDYLVAIRRLDQEYASQSAATSAAKRAWIQARDRNLGGLTTYLEVVVSENLALQSELAFINLAVRRQIATVQLIKSLGGGWRPR
ncbi:MAG: efflux transporter outer membrane subunit [Legionella sp.]|nr:efflux transporter outer membrane subunit [Legionella sp.]